jgi:FixJ family two-component response regulator
LTRWFDFDSSTPRGEARGQRLRERQVLDALMAGRATKEIAHDLGLSVRTVEVHRARMLRRLGARFFLKRCGWPR